MAFDVLRTQELDTSFPEYSFYSGIKNKYVTVTLQSDGDTSSQFDEIEDAVAFYNKLPGLPEVAIRSNTERSPTKRTYAFDYGNKKVTRTTSSSIKKTIQLNQNRADILAKFQLLNNFVEGCDTSSVIPRDDYLSITAILRSLNITSISELNNYFPANIPVRNFLNLETLHGLSVEDAASLAQEVPELSQFMDLTNHTTITQTQIDLAISSISNLSNKLGLDIGLDANVPENLGDKILALPGFDAYASETDTNGAEFFPEGTKSSAITNSNFDFFETTRVNVPESNRARIEQLIQEGRAFFNPFDASITKITAASDSAETSIGYGLSLLPGDAKLTALGTVLTALDESVENFNTHISKLTTIIPPTTTNAALSLSSALGTSLQNLLSNPLGGLDSSAADSFEVVAMVENSSQFVAEQAATVDGDWDSLDKKGAFRLTSIDPLMGSLISPSYQLILQELLAVVSEIPNYITDRETMCRKHDLLVVRYDLVKKERELQALVDTTIPEYAGLVAAEAALAKAVMYFDQRISNSIALNVNAVDEFKTHFTYIGAWVPGVLTYYTGLLTNIVVAEISGYRSASIRSQRFNLLDQSKTSATLLNAIATPELNQAAKEKKSTDDNVIRTSIPLKRVTDTDFEGTFKLAHFVGPDVGAPYRLRNFERDYMGEVNVFTSEDIKNNLRAINNNILAPMQAVGFDFEVIRGLRPFNHEKGEAGKYNNSDHHYGLAVDIKLKDPNLTGIAAAYIRKRLPWNKLVLFNFNQGSKANSDAYIHISHYSKPSHGWDKNQAIYPTGCGSVKVIGGNGVSIPNFFAFDSSDVADIPAPPNQTIGLTPNSVRAIHLDGSDAGAMRIKLGLGNVNNTSDANKPISTATQTALNQKANIDLISGGSEVPATNGMTIGLAHRGLIIVGSNSADISVTLASPATLGTAWVALIAASGTGSITVNGTFDNGDTQIELAPEESMLFQSNGTTHRALLRSSSGGGTPTVTITYERHIGSGSAGPFTLSSTPVIPEALTVTVGPLIQPKDGTAYTVVGDQITFTEPVQTDTYWSEEIIEPVGLIGVLPESVGAVELKTTDATAIRTKIDLGNVNNTSDANKPISTATQTALDGKLPTSHAGQGGAAHALATQSVAGFMSGPDKTKLDTLDKFDVGLGSVDNTTDLAKPISTATQTALDNLRGEIFTGEEVVFTSNTTITSLHNRKVIVGNSGSTISFTLSSPAALQADWMALISNTGAGDLLVNGTFDDGSTGVTLETGGSMMLQSNGTVHRLLLRGGGGSTGGSSVTIPIRQTIIGDGGATYALSAIPTSEDAVLFFIGGAIQSNSSFVLAGSNVTFDAVVPNGVLIEVYIHLGTEYLGVSPLYAKHTGTNSAGPFTLLVSPYTTNSLGITIGGIKQPKDGSAYTVVGDQITFADPIPSVTYWEEEHIQPISITETAAESITASHIKTSETTAIRNKLGLSSVDNTADLAKPISTLTQSALDLKQPLDSDLTAIAALTTTSFGRGFLDLADDIAGRTKLDVAQKQASTTDATAGRGLIVGAFGLGGSSTMPTIADANSLVETGIYSTSGSFTGSPFVGTNGSNQGFLFHRSWGFGSLQYAVQEFRNVNGSHVSKVRRKDNGVWSAWFDSFTSQNILGTVGQSSGVPTGAIIERGSNANGSYVRFADGTQICWGTFSGLDITSASTGGWFVSNSAVGVTFPIAFSHAPVMTAQDSNPVVIIHAAYSSLSAGTIHGHYYVSLTGRGGPWSASGRWF